MNKTIINIFTYLVIFLAITQIINYLYNGIYGSLIFFLILSTGLYLITKKNVPISLLLAIVITNILNVSDILDNNLYEGRRDRRAQRSRITRQNRESAKRVAVNEADIEGIKNKLDDLYEKRRDAHENRNRLVNEHSLAIGKAEIYNTELDDAESELTAVKGNIETIDNQINDYQTRLTRYPGIPPYDDPNPPITSMSDVIGITKLPAPPPTPTTFTN